MVFVAKIVALIILLLMFDGVYALIGAAVSAVPALGSLFSSESGVKLEEVMLSIDEDMNRRGAVKMHIVIVYEEELSHALTKLSARQYFRSIEQLKKDFPDKMHIFAWELIAKKRLTPWIKIDKYPKDHMTPIAGYIFVDYSTAGDHRAKIPPSKKKIRIILAKDEFHIADDTTKEVQLGSAKMLETPQLPAEKDLHEILEKNVDVSMSEDFQQLQNEMFNR